MLVTEKTLQRERYRIVEQFESGNFTAVYAAYDNIFRANVILREFTPEIKKFSPAQMQNRKLNFVEKARVLTGIRHDLLPRVHDYFSEADNHYLVLEMIDGSDLGKLLEKSKKPFALSDVADWSDQILDALALLHKHVPPIIHGDIKPQHIKFTEGGKIKLIAFGNIDGYQPKPNAVNDDSVSETAALPYLPLEQIWQKLDSASQKVILHSYDEKSQKILEQPADARTDIYAVGATLYHLVTGQAPADALARTIDLIDGNADPLLPPNELNSAVPSAISDVILRAMEIRRENRFDSAVILRQVLRTSFVKIREANTRQIEQAKEKARIEHETELAKQAEITELAKQAEIAEERRLDKQKSLAAARQKIEAERLLIRRKEAEKRKNQGETPLSSFNFAVSQTSAVEQTAAAPLKSDVHRPTLTLDEPAKEEVSPIKIKADSAFRIGEIDEQTKAGIVPAVSAPAENISAPTAAPEIKFVPGEEIIEPVKSSETFENLEKTTLEMTRNYRIRKRMVAAAGILLLSGGALFGVWTKMSAKTQADNGEISPPVTSVSEAAKPAPAIETAAPPENPAAETKPVLTNTTAPDKVDTGQVDARTAAPDAKIKQITVAPAVPNSSKIRKPNEPAAKPSAVQPVQKKPVTVDDLINDN